MKTFIVLLSVVSGTAFAQYYEDEPIPFEDEAPVAPFAPLPKRENIKDSDDFSRFVRHKDTPFRSLASQDDPSVGLNVDIHGGALWLDESKKGSTVRFAFGARLTWEWSRTFLDDEYWRKAFFVDLTWSLTQIQEGTKLVYTKATRHYFVLAPALSLPMGKSPFSFFVQGGVGLLFLSSTVKVDYAPSYAAPVDTNTKGMFLLGQYGAGLRARFSPNPQKALFVVFRTELTGYVHRYTHELMLSVGMGIGF